MEPKSLGLLINPVAGIGGPAGLKGSDGLETQRLALCRGVRPRAAVRALAALAPLAATRPGQLVLTVGGPMGQDAVTAAGLSAEVVYTPEHPTTARDTTAAVKALAGAGAGLILFVGGDGTARDVVDADAAVMALGVPAGVKMYSNCFAVSPVVAGRVAARWLKDAPVEVRVTEVLDVDEHALVDGPVAPVLYGLLSTPGWEGTTQNRKVASTGTERERVVAAATEAVQVMQPGVYYLLGPGGTTLEVGRLLGLDVSPLGVDIVLDGRLICRDASEADIISTIDGQIARAIVTIIGGQGFVLGRGNQQLSASVIRRLAPDPLIIVADEDKLVLLAGRPLLIDTGDVELDAALSGFARVLTGPNTVAIYRMVAAGSEEEALCD